MHHLAFSMHFSHVTNKICLYSGTNLIEYMSSYKFSLKKCGNPEIAALSRGKVHVLECSTPSGL